MITEDKRTRLRTLPLLLYYQIDVWDVSLESAATLFSELIFYILDNPKLNVNFSEFDEPSFSYISIEDIVDNTDISLELSKGMLYRYTILISFQGYLFKTELSDSISFKDFDIGYFDLDTGRDIN